MTAENSKKFALSRALLKQIKKDDTVHRRGLFAVYLRARSPLVRFTYSVLENQKSFGALACLVFGYGRGLAPLGKSGDTLALYVLANERRGLERFFHNRPQVHVTYFNAQLRSQIGSFSSRELAGIPKLFSFFRDLLDRHPLFVVLRVAETSSYFGRFLHLLTTSGVKDVYFSSEGNPHGNALIEAIRISGAKGHYVSHAPCALEPGAMRVCSAHFIGAAGLNQYLKAGAVIEKVYVENYLFPSEKPQIKKIGLHKPLSICVCLSKDSETTQVQTAVAELKSVFKKATISIRPHPHSFQQQGSPDMAEADELKNFDIVFAGKSNVHFEALTRGVPSVYHPGLDANTPLVYNFLMDGTVFVAESWSAALPESVNAHYSTNEFAGKLESYICNEKK